MPNAITPTINQVVTINLEDIPAICCSSGSVAPFIVGAIVVFTFFICLLLFIIGIILFLIGKIKKNEKRRKRGLKFILIGLGILIAVIVIIIAINFYFTTSRV